MQILEESIEEGVRARRFDLVVDDVTVPGMHWLPLEPPPKHATICIAHGGFQHKNYGNVPELAVQFVQHLSVGVVALDAPGHGDRITDHDAAKRARAAAMRAAGEGRGLGLDPKARAALATRVVKHIAEWRALLDALQTDDRWHDGPFGWWGVSMGTAHGIPVVAQDDRITAAVFGLNALTPGDETMARQAASITIPILFHVQSEDELMTRDAALDLWDAFGSKRKTLHLNPGGHVQVPRFERQASEDFFRHHLMRR
jgi:dienelactone hydrolase